MEKKDQRLLYMSIKIIAHALNKSSYFVLNLYHSMRRLCTLLCLLKTQQVEVTTVFLSHRKGSQIM